MPEYTSVQRDYAKYRLDKSKEDLEAAKLLFEKGVFPIEMSKMIGSALTIRNASDYDDMFIASKDETAEQIANAERVYKMVSVYIEKLS